MRRLAAALVLFPALLAGSTARAQTPPSEAELKARRDAVLAGEWFKKGGWTTDLNKACAEARKGEKLIFCYYTATEPESPPCRDYEKDFLSSEKFLSWTKKKKLVLLCSVTAGIGDDSKPFRKARGPGWPWFAFLDHTGTVIVHHWPGPELEGFEETAARAERYAELSKKAANGGAKEKIDVIIAALDLGRIKAADARARLASLGPLSDEQKKALEQADTDCFVSDLALDAGSDPDRILAAGRKFVEHKNSGKPLPVFRADVQAYWIAVMKVAETDKAPALYEEALKALEERYGKEESAKEFFEGCRKTLADLKAGAKK